MVVDRGVARNRLEHVLSAGSFAQPQGCVHMDPP